MPDKNNTCYTCVYRKAVPGSAHSTCTFSWRGSNLTPPPASEHAKKKGWYFFPFDYDPIWQKEECAAHTQEG